MTTKPLSQSIERLELLRTELAQVDELPQAAQKGRDQALASVEVVSRATTAIQVAVADLAVVATRQLEAAETAAKEGDLARLALTLRELRPVGVEADRVVTEHAGVVTAQVIKVNETIAGLRQSSNALQVERAGLDAKVKRLQQNADELEKKKWYYLLLGPFGLVGLGIMTGLLIDAANKVSAGREDAKKLARKSACLARAIAATQDLVEGLLEIQTRVNTVTNAVHIVASEVSGELESVGDGQCAKDPTVARLFIAAAKQLVEAMRQDAA